ncbi:hypothetical protein PILCRDRAFT_767 [Piloderma croceum F 1598]|uniref:Uncharacterized protein n=1 Tax=Piloderma croceum (strain F 1598) TaxID=765440 RepID=A0A0C3GM95_PILCF|nr:hypothetical protein PILCRDRAFT_767 [Piloderma croceum F 1598]
MGFPQINPQVNMSLVQKLGLDIEGIVRRYGGGYGGDGMEERDMVALGIKVHLPPPIKSSST